MINFQDIFPRERIISIKELSPGYDDHASDVWRVKTEKREVIVRASGIENVKCTGAFFKSLNILFGIDPTNVFAMEAINNTLSGLNAFVYPKILEKHKIDREYAVVELLQGATLDSFVVLSDNELRKFGSNLAKIHSYKMNYWGNPVGTFMIGIDNVNNHVIRSMKEIVNEFYLDNYKIVNYLPQMEQILCKIPAPEYSSFVLVDIDPSQFLSANGVITGLVDTEAYVIAPRELDFIALEYVLDRRSAELISEGYEAVLSIPDLKSVRTVYRYLYRLIEIQGDDDIDDWLSRPTLF
jgi:hypothetical protein